VWDVKDKVLVHPAKLKSWITLDFALCNMTVLSTFVEDLTQAMRDRGE
jgi:hypothetical protein